MPSIFKRKFTIKHDVNEDRWHWGINFCIDWKDVNGNRDKYIFICFGKHDFSIGIITIYEEMED